MSSKGAARRGLRSEGSYQLPGVADPRVSPDGELVALVVNGVDQQHNGQTSAI
jgi:hypothetical protein